jgi:hypothetical protein
MKKSFTRVIRTVYRVLFEINRELQIIFYPKPEIITRFLPVNKKVVYTIILGDYDNLKEPEIISEGWDYICFTNRDDLRSEIWKIVKVKCPCKLNLKRCSSFFTVFPFNYLNQYELSVLVGGQISIHCDLNEFVRYNFPPDKSIAISVHPARSCIYDEAKKVIELKKDSVRMVGMQMKKYQRMGFPRNFGLVRSGVLIRRHEDIKLIRHCRLWLKEIQKYSQRDQLSFNYILWKHRLIDPEILPAEILKSSFMIHKHNYKQQFN